jgi:hypothetical protein
MKIKRVTDAAKLSETQHACVVHMRKHGNTMQRYPGGFWAEPGLAIPANTPPPNGWYSTPTLQALAKRGVVECAEYAGLANARFPVKYVLTPAYAA